MKTVTQTVGLYRKQAEFRNSPAHYRGFFGGRGSGKSWVGAYDLLRRAKRDRTYLVGSPTGLMLADLTFPAVREIAETLGIWDAKAVKLTPYPTVRLTTGATLRFRTADRPDAMRGPNLSGVYLDEASLMQEAVFLICIAALREKGEQGWLSAVGTPQGPAHWTHETFNTNKPDTAIFRARTSDNPFNPAGFEDKLQLLYGDTNWARQELGGEFVQLEGTEFPSHWLSGDIFFDAWPDDLMLKVIALDPSKGGSSQKDDYQAHVLVGVRIDSDGRFIFYVDAVLERVGVTMMCERTVALCREFAASGRLVDSVIVEENGTMGLISPAFDRAAAKANYLIPYVCRNNSDNKEFRIRSHCSPPLSRCQIRFRRTPGGRLLVGQLLSFPLDEHDDGPDALATGLRRVAELLAAKG